MWQFDELSDAIQSSAECPEVLRMRGYTLRKRAQRRLVISLPGAFEVEVRTLVAPDYS